MTRRRYIAFLADSAGSCRHWKPKLGAAADGTGLAIVLDRADLLVASEGDVLSVRPRGGPSGVILGTMFRRGAKAAGRVSMSEAKEIVETGGAALIRDFWGPYVAIMPDPRGGSSVIRAPLGDLACYYMPCTGGVVLSSDVDLLVRFGGRRFDFDWASIAAHLIAPEIRGATTCLAGVRELSGGGRLSNRGGVATETLWSPWRFTARAHQVGGRADAAALIRDTVCNAVAARVACHDATVLLLSGGLDSSIVAAALARAGNRTTALTMVTRDPGGDERRHARTTAGHLSIPLLEIARETGAVDIGRSAAAGLPYPSERSFSQATMLAANGAADAAGAGAIVHGGGGDNIFCALQSAAPVADMILSGNFSVWGLIRDIAALAQVTNLAVMRQTIRRAWLRGAAYRWGANLALLSAEAAGLRDAALRHPWLDAPPGTLPGSAAHVALVLGASSLVQSPDARLRRPSIAVLLAQPIVEACLSMPTWLWFERGCNRAVARNGFSSMLPPAVAWRPSKGALDSFIIECFEANRTRLKQMLLDGMLAGSGLIDRAALAEALNDMTPVRDQTYARVMHFADVEAWLRSWA